jgi:hypothetical protein
MIVAVLQYPAYLPSFDETVERCRAVVPVFETEVSGLIDKTWGMNEDLGRMCSVYHFEDRPSAEAYFATEGFREFVKTTLQDQLEIELYEVAAIAYRRSLKSPPEL